MLCGCTGPPYKFQDGELGDARIHRPTLQMRRSPIRKCRTTRGSKHIHKDLTHPIQKKNATHLQRMLQIFILTILTLTIQIFLRLKHFITAMTDTIDERKFSKIINLAKLQPSDFRIWLSQAEATFNFYDCLNIVKGIEHDPTPQGQIPGTPIPLATCKLITSWTTRHALAREALLRCLDRSELIKVHDLPLAFDIWARLKEEHSAISDALYAKAETQFHSFGKTLSSSMQIHINEFTKLLADTQYHAPPGTPKMTDAQVNLAFLRSLGPNYETFQQAMGEQIYKLKPGELYARVKALAESKDEPHHHIAASNGSTKALAIRISGRHGSGLRAQQANFRGGFRGKFNSSGAMQGRDRGTFHWRLGQQD
jgi:hypothetical protein